MKRSQSPSEPTLLPRRRILALAVVGLLLLPVLLYLPALRGPFVFDDLTAVLETARDWGVENLGESLRFWQPSRFSYRPVRTVSLALDWKLGGGSTLPFHLTNSLLHGLNAVLLAGLVWRLFRRPTLALLAALIFLVHPIQTGAVAYISGRKDLLCAAFYFLALHGSLLAATGRRRGAILAGSALFFVAGLLSFLSKEMALTLPAAALLADRLRAETATADDESARGRFRIWFDLLRRRPIFYGLMLTGGTAGLVYKLILAPGTKVPIGGVLDPLRNLPVAAQSISWLTRKALWPWPHLADTRGLFPDGATVVIGPEAGNFGSFWNGGGLVATAIGLVLLAVIVLLARRIPIDRRIAGASGLVFFGLALLPVANFIRLNEPAAEHYLYLPLAGLALTVAAMPADLFAAAGGRRTAARIVVALLLLAMAAATTVRSADWSDARRLWTDVLEINPGCARAHNALGGIELDEGNRAAAVDRFGRAVLLDPDQTRMWANLMTQLRELDRLDNALAAGEAAMQRHPDNPLILSLQGGLLLAANRPGQARPLLEAVAARAGEGADVDPNWPLNRALARLATDDVDGALAVLEEATRNSPDNPVLWTNLGHVLLRLERPDEARSALERAVSLPGVSPIAHQNLAVALLSLERPHEARRHLAAARAAGLAVPEGLVAAVDEAVEGRSADE